MSIAAIKVDENKAINITGPQSGVSLNYYLLTSRLSSAPECYSIEKIGKLYPFTMYLGIFDEKIIFKLAFVEQAEL